MRFAAPQQCYLEFQAEGRPVHPGSLGARGEDPLGPNWIYLFSTIEHLSHEEVRPGAMAWENSSHGEAKM